VLSRGKDLTILSSGLCTEEACKAVALLKPEGWQWSTCTFLPSSPAITPPSCRPWPAKIRRSHARESPGARRARINRAEKIAENGLGVKLYRLGLQDTFAHGASRGYLMREYGLDALALVQTAEQALKTDLGIRPEDLARYGSRQ